MSSQRTPLLFATLVLTACAAVLPASAAQLPGHHPAYLRALTDLRAARWDLEHRPGDPAVSAQENAAVSETDAAISELKLAAEEDGKNLAAAPHEEGAFDRAGRLHRALSLMMRAHDDVRMEEDNPATRDARGRIEQHIDQAVQATERAIHDAEQHH